MTDQRVISRRAKESLRREHLRIAFLTYRGNPYCGGQGVYTRHLSRALVEDGHEVTVFSGQPYPELDDGVELVTIPSLDLYRDLDPFRVPRLREITSTADLLELCIMRAGGFPEPRTFGLRLREEIAARIDSFDIVHDNQSLSHAVGRMSADGWPVIASIHHPISIDRSLELQHADRKIRRAAIRRWYGFARMQTRVAQQIRRIVTVSEYSRDDIVREIAITPARIGVVPVGVDTEVFHPFPEIARIPGRLMTTASADVPLKGLAPLLEALAKVRTERHDAHLIVIGKPKEQSPVASLIDHLGLDRAVTFVAGESDRQIARRYAESSCAVVPSLYEGFSLPAIEAMACATPLVATTGGALPEVVGSDGVSALLVPPDEPSALVVAILRVLSDGDLSTRIATAGFDRVVSRFTWQRCAIDTAMQYRIVLEEFARC